MNIEGMTITDVVDIMIYFKITARQFMLLMILETDKRGGNAIHNVYRIAEEHIENWSISEIDDLIQKELVYDHSPKGGKRDIYPDNLKVSDTFCETILSSMSDFQNFWNLYPGFVDNFTDFRGPKIPLKAISFEECEQLYMKYIRTKKKHLQVMEILQWAIDNNNINMNIGKYIGSKMWDQHLELQFSEAHNPMSKSIV